MIKVTCDTCAMVRSPGQEDWILGYDLMLDTPQTVSRSISFFDNWDDSRILQRGAIHFCSPVCKQAYVAANSVNKKMPARRRSTRNGAARKLEGGLGGGNREAGISTRRRTGSKCGRVRSW